MSFQQGQHPLAAYERMGLPALERFRPDLVLVLAGSCALGECLEAAMAVLARVGPGDARTRI